LRLTAVPFCSAVNQNHLHTPDAILNVIRKIKHGCA